MHGLGIFSEKDCAIILKSKKPNRAILYLLERKGPNATLSKFSQSTYHLKINNFGKPRFNFNDMTQKQVRLSGYFSYFEFEFEKEMIVRLEKVGVDVKLSITEPTSNLTESEIETLITFVKMAVDMLCLP